MEYLGTERIVVPVARGLDLTVLVCLWAVRRSDNGEWLARWGLPPELADRSNHVRWTGEPAIVAGVSAVERAPVWLRGLDGEHPVWMRLDQTATAAAATAVRDWLAGASSSEGAAHDHERDGRAAE